MRSRSQNIVVSPRVRLLLAFSAIVIGACNSFAHTKGHIICRQELTTSKRTELSLQLRAITGWPTLAFDDAGVLSAGEQAVAVGGSRSARELINAALSGPSLLILEDASNRSDIAFLRVIPGRWIGTSNANPPAFVVQIDFADFDHLSGDREARKSFNVAWGLLHEIDHVVHGSPDPTILEETGECEDHINRMRSECNLPLRLEYFFTDFPHTGLNDFATRLVRIPFERAADPDSKRKRYWLIWDATVIGGLNQLMADLR